jgi:hypothetical protein
MIGFFLDILEGKGMTAMSVKAKIFLCAALVLLAALSLAVVLGSLGVLSVSAAEDSVYLVREYEGYVSVFYPAGSETPTSCTDIRVKDLPWSDRVELASGIGFSDYSQVVQLLEDFGS